MEWKRDTMEEERILKLRALEEKFGIPWHSTCYPLNPDLFRSHPNDLYDLGYKIKDLLKSAIKEHADDDVKGLVSGEPCPSTDIVSILSLSSDGDHDLIRNNGERVQLNNAIFEGKYVLVCCFHVPVPWGRNRVFHHLINLCNELCSIRHDFEMVMVAKMANFTDTRAVFDHFFSGFPESVLAVPYEDSKRRNSICNLLDLSPKRSCIRCLFLDTDGSVLPPFLDDIEEYGAEAFPFTREILDDVTAKQKQLRRNGTLEQLLRPYESSPDDVFVYKFDDPSEVVNISQLRNKHVGLYNCDKGERIPYLNKVYKQCRKKQMDFEIVVLYCPFIISMPNIFQEEVDSLMQKEGVCGWWCLPFNNSVSLRFSRLTRSYSDGEGCEGGDKVIIVGHNGEILDMYGAEFMRRRPIDDVYPFARVAIIDKEMKKLSEMTLESVLVDHVFRGNDRSDVVSVNELIGKKKVILYTIKLRYLDVDGSGCGYAYGYREVVSRYHEGSEFELVFIAIKENEDVYEEEEEEEFGNSEDEEEFEDTEGEEEEEDSEAGQDGEEEFEDTEGEEEEDSEARQDGEEEVEDRKISAIPWYVYPLDGTRSASLNELMRYPYQFYGFGVDGQIYSLGNKICLDDTLRKDVNRLHSFDGYSEI